MAKMSGFSDKEEPSREIARDHFANQAAQFALSRLCEIKKINDTDFEVGFLLPGRFPYLSFRDVMLLASREEKNRILQKAYQMLIDQK